MEVFSAATIGGETVGIMVTAVVVAWDEERRRPTRFLPMVVTISID